MTAKEYLNQLRWLNREINEKIEESEYLRAKAEGRKSLKISDMPKGKETKDGSIDAVIKLVDLQVYIDARTDELIDLRSTITKQIHELKNQRSRTVLAYRYLQQMPWEMISKKLAYDKSSLHHIHRKALKEFEKAYPEIKDL